MKTDYVKLGQESMDSFRNSVEHAAEVQTRLLLKLMRRNRDTVYGKRYGFGEIKTVREFQERVPLSVFEDYEEYIGRMIRGEENLLAKEPAIYYCISSGTTGEAKYLPMTETDMMLQNIYSYGIPFGVVREYYRDWPAEKVFGKIFQIGEFARTFMENGVMNGIRSGCQYQWMDRDGEFDAEDYCVPKEVLFPDTLEDLLYLKVRYALEERDIRAIHGVFINRMGRVMDYICRNWEMLLNDMEYGRVDESVQISAKWREYAEQKLPPNPLRAEELRRISCGTEGFIKKIWPDVRYILAIGGKKFAYYTRKVKEYAGDIPIYHFAYAASEGIFGVAEKMNQADRYVLSPEAGFFEFLPLESEESQTVFLWELEVGKQYELVFTNHSGLYRYRIGDVLEVTGWYKEAPIVRFCYRRHQLINMAGENSNQEQLEQAVKCFASRVDCEIVGYCVQEDVSGPLPRYLFYLEGTGADVPSAEDILDSCLCSANYSYGGCRKMNEIGKVRIAYLRKGSFDRYLEHLARSGKRMGQTKRICILNTPEKRQFFRSQTLDMQGEEKQK